MEPVPVQQTIDRANAIAQAIDQVRADGMAGKQTDDAAILAAHPGLIPELKVELQKLRRVEAARRAADRSTADRSTADRSASEAGTTAEAVARDFEKPSLQIPGYSIVREINRGGQAVVFIAIHLNTGRKVAVKVMHRGPLADERSLARFKREVQILATLNHPNIVGIIDTGRTDDGGQFISMDYIAGYGLAEYMQRRQKKDGDPSKLLRLFMRICDAVNAAHRQGIVHRDLKPGNIRVDERGEPYILDFGLARTAFDRMIPGGHEPVSITGEFLGSLPWSSPEQAQGDPDQIDVRTDVYSLGVILYQMLTGGRFPYRVVGNIRDVLNNILTSEPTPPSKMIAASEAIESRGNRKIRTHESAAVNEAIEKIVLKALAKKPSRRYQTAGELGRDVGNYLAGRRTAAREPEADAPRTFRTRYLTRPVIIALLVVALGALTFTSQRVWRHFNPGFATVAGLQLTPIDMLPVPPSETQWELTWNDEFDGNELDAAKWADESGAGGSGAASDEAFSLDGNGHLIVSTAKEGNRFLISHLTTAGKFEHTFGCFVCRVLLQEDSAQASAFSLQSDDATVDVFAMQGAGGAIEHGMAANRQPRQAQTAGLSRQDGLWHTLAVWWTPEEYIYYIDGRESWRTSATDVSQVPKHLIFSSGMNAVAQNAPSADCMLVDYVRVYVLKKTQ